MKKNIDSLWRHECLPPLQLGQGINFQTLEQNMNYGFFVTFNHCAATFHHFSNMVSLEIFGRNFILTLGRRLRVWRAKPTSSEMVNILVTQKCTKSQVERSSQTFSTSKCALLSRYQNRTLRVYIAKAESAD